MKYLLNRFSLGGVAVLVIVIVAVNLIASRIYTRLDMTEDNIYSVSEGTENILAKLDSEIIAKLYFSRSNKGLPPQLKTYATRVQEVLGEYTNISGGKLALEVYDPQPDTDDEEAARSYGIRGIPLPTGEEAYFGIVFLKGSREHAIPYLDPRREEFLEYDLSESIVRLQDSAKPKIGVLSSLPVVGSAPNPMDPHGGQGWVVFEQLKRSFEVVSIKPDEDHIAEDIKILFVLHPKNFGIKTDYAIDQYVMNGGRLVLALDPFARIDMAQQQQLMAGMRQMQMPQTGSNLPRLLDAWKVDFTADRLVGDRNRMVQVSGGGGMPVPYPFVFQVEEEELASDSVVTERLKTIMYAEGGSFAAASKDVELQSLVTTTDDAGYAEAQMAGLMGPAQTAQKLKLDKGKKTLVGIASAKFKSAFPDGPPDGVENKNHLKEAAFKNSIFLIGDVDFMYDANAVTKMQFGPQTIIRPKNDNLNLVLNAVEFMSGSEDLISIRSSGKIARPFTKVQELQKKAQERWQAKEQELSARLQELQGKLNQLQQQRTDGGRFTLTAQQQSEIERFRAEEIEIRKSRRIVRRNLREDIERLGNQLIALNMLVVPAGVGMFGLVVFLRRSRRMKRRA